MIGASDVFWKTGFFNGVTSLPHPRLTTCDDAGSAPLLDLLVNRALHEVGKILAGGVPDVLGSGTRNMHIVKLEMTASTKEM